MEDALNALKAALYERFSNPLLSSFALAWTTWNFKYLVLIFKSNDWIEFSIESEAHHLSTARLLSQTYTKNFESEISYWLGAVGNNLVVPALITVILIFIVPQISQRVYRLHLRIQRTLAEIKIDSEGKKPIDQEKANELYRKIEDLRDASVREQKEIRQENETLKTLIEANQNNLEQEQANSKAILDQKEDALGKINELRDEISAMKQEADDLVRHLKSLTDACRTGTALRINAHSETGLLNLLQGLISKYPKVEEGRLIKGIEKRPDNNFSKNEISQKLALMEKIKLVTKESSSGKQFWSLRK